MQERDRRLNNIKHELAAGKIAWRELIALGFTLDTKGAVVIRIQVAFESPNFDVPCKENEIKVSGILYRLISVVLL